MNPKDNIEKLIETKSMQFRDFSISKYEIRAAEDGKNEMVVEGCACVFDTPTVICKIDGVEYKEQVDKNAFKKCNMSDVIFNRDHCGRVYARTRNNSLKLEVKEDGLYMSATLWEDDLGHAELYRDIKRGNIDKMSFAFTVNEDKYDSDARMRTITGIDRLFDVSAVSIPAYDTTSISARSFFDAEREKELAVSKRKAEALALAKAKFEYLEV